MVKFVVDTSLAAEKRSNPRFLLRNGIAESLSRCIVNIEIGSVIPENAKRLSNAHAALTPSLLSPKDKHHLTLNFDITSSSQPCI